MEYQIPSRIVKSSEIPLYSPVDGLTIRALVGKSGTIQSKICLEYSVAILEFTCKGKMYYRLPVMQSVCFVYVIHGSGSFGANQTPASEGENLVFGRGDDLSFTSSSGGLSFLLLSGETSREPVCRHGSIIAKSRRDMVRLFAEQAMFEFTRNSQRPHEK